VVVLVLVQSSASADGDVLGPQNWWLLLIMEATFCHRNLDGQT
jgi:hypothetical protein